MKIEKFEDIEALKKSRVLVNKIYQLTTNGNISKYYGLKDQIQRAQFQLCQIFAKDSTVVQIKHSFSF